MSATLQPALTAGHAELYLDLAVRNLVVIDYLDKRCKWCGKQVFDSATKPREFCNNKNVCCNNYSRHDGITLAQWQMQRARAKRKKLLFKLIRDKANSFSRCLFCNTAFVNGEGKPTFSSFAFCGESLLVTGECKKAWLAALPTPRRPPTPFSWVAPEDVERAEKRKMDHRYKLRQAKHRTG